MPDYIGLTRTLLEPLLEDSSTLQVDTEVTAGGKRVLVRVSIQQEEKGRVFGRGGRTIQAVRRVLSAAAELAQQRLVLDVGDLPHKDSHHHHADEFGTSTAERPSESNGGERSDPRRRRSRSRTRPRLRKK